MKSIAATDENIFRFAGAWPDVRRFHFVGIGGISMSGLAEILLKLGFEVSGSDQQKSVLTDRLASLGATIYHGHHSEHVKDAEVVVYSAAVSPDNSEMVQARTNGALLLSRADLLDGFCRQGKTVAIAGTHGKSTTTTMIGLMLLDCGLDPTLIVGGVIPALGSNVRMGRGPYLAVEADEYSRSFLELSPEIAVVTSIDADHLEYYGSQDAIDEAFLAFVHATPCYQPVILCMDDPGVQRLLPRIRRRILTYGIDSDADVRATDIVLERLRSSCDVHIHGRFSGRLTMDRPGRYHILDALAAVATGHRLEIASDEILSSLSRFTGLERRFEVKGMKNGITVVDDYAHHPAEIAALLSGVTDAGGRVVAVFQPHLYSRTLEFADAFGQALSQADLVVLTDVYASREQPIEGVTGELVAEATRKHGNPEVTYVPDKTQLAERVSEQLQRDDLVITIGAGDITEVGDEILKRI